METARLRTGLVHYDHVGAANQLGLTGSEECTGVVDDNVFTVLMARWNLPGPPGGPRGPEAVPSTLKVPDLGHSVMVPSALGGTMFARVAVWEPMPDDDRQWVIDAAKAVPGVREAYHLVDPDTGNGLSIAVFDDDADVSAVKAAIARRAEEIGWNELPHPAPASETFYRVIRRG